MRFLVREHLTSDGRSPFREWLKGLEAPVRARIQARVLRLESGNLGDYKAVGAGVLEARIAHGPGYRVYFAVQGRRLILLLGGDKRSQTGDILRARQLWSDNSETRGDGTTK